MLFELLILFLIILVCVIGLVTLAIYKKNIHIWLWNYLSRRREPPVENEPIHILFAFCDHFEPRWGNATPEVEANRVDRWCLDYPKLASKHRDADGCHPKHSFFFPEEEYRASHLEKLANLCADGFGEVEIHIHHDDDTAQGLSSTLQSFLETLDRNHGVVPKDERTNEYRFAFIHGNWALDNSRKDGRWCGVNNELAVLRNLGCYADFTLPSAPSDTQTSKINSIYYANGIEGKSKSHNNGIDLKVGVKHQGDLVIIQGPLGLSWRNRKYGLFPRIENADIRKNFPPDKDRVDLWINTAVHVHGQPQWRFVKIHTHGTQEQDMDTILGDPVDAMFDYLESHYNDGKDYVLHYVSAREMFNIAKAAEAGETGDPNEHRNYQIQPPPILKSKQG